MELRGKYSNAKIFTDNVDETTIGQVINLCNQEFSKDSNIRIMPDCHAGAGCVIGTTMKITDKIVPNLVGVDIGCGVTVKSFKKRKMDLNELDSIIRKNIPSGFNINEKPYPRVAKWYKEELEKYNDIVPLDRALKSIGTLGGGNHFIELNEDDENYYLVVHSGSRNLGKQIAEFHQKRATELHPECPKDLAYLDLKTEYAYYTDYIKDMLFAQHYARINRFTILDTILEKLKIEENGCIESVHNYIDNDSKILRKGAVSAIKGEILIIPINMRDGSLICVGKGNEDWNCSAPHGAGRILSRGQAKSKINIEEFKKSMEGIYSTCVNNSTIDESPMAYKDIDSIVSNISDTVEIQKIIKPIYNFKNSQG